MDSREIRDPHIFLCPVLGSKRLRYFAPKISTLLLEKTYIGVCMRVYVYFTSPPPLFIYFFPSASETGLEVPRSHQKMPLPVVFLTRNRSRSVWNHPRKPQFSGELFSNFAGTEHWISDRGVKMADVGGFAGRGEADT